MNHRPDCIARLSQATSLDDSVIGESVTPSPNHAAYNQASAISGLESADLQWLLANGSPAGRIYAAVLMKQSSRFGDSDSFGKLVSDTSPVTVRSGCDRFQTTVGDVCKRFISDGYYCNLRFSTPLSEWHSWKSGSLAAVQIEKQLYKSRKDKYFYVHVAIRNTSSRMIAVDLNKPHRLIYPNQWTTNDQGQRNIVDERRKITQGLDAAISAALLSAFRSGELPKIQPGAEITYYVNFNGCDSAKVDQQKAKFIVVSMDGQLWLTDGTITETIARNTDDITSTDFSVSLPIKWRNLPDDATLVM